VPDHYDFPRTGHVRPAGTMEAEPSAQPAESCDLCGSSALEWRKCKLVCMHCRSIVKSCADL
jgi:hypothetical protein